MFWDKYVTLCNEKKVSPTRAIKEMGFSSSAVVKWRRGAKVRGANLQKVCDYFGVPSTYFDETPNVEVLPLANVFEIPIYESVSAGLGAYASSSVLGYMPIYLDNASLAAETLCIRVKGDSMYPKIENGDTVVVHKTDYVESGTIAVVMFEDEGYIKRIEYAGDKVLLHSINPMYPPLTFEGADVARLRVVGKVVKIVKDL